MATNKKVDLETEAALKAVEDALSFDGNINNDDPFAAFEKDIASAATDLRETEVEIKNTAKASSSQVAPDLTDDPALMAANDDRKNTVEDLVYGLQQKPSNAPYWFALIFSAFWVGIMYFYTQSTQPSLLQNLTTTAGFNAKLNNTTTYIYLAGLLSPIIIAFGFASLMRRASEMKIAANSMTVAAVKLLQPEDIANESVASVGYAVRREVKAMGDGVNHALARASELESMVKDEVLNIERSYADSEIKIGSLVNDLSTQREAIIEHADKLRESIGDTHSGLTSELDNASTVLKATVEEAGIQLTSALSSAQIGATSTLNVASDSLVEQIHAAGSDAANLLNTQTLNLRDQSSKITQDIEDSIGLRVSEFSSRLEDTGSSLQNMLDSRLENIQDTISVKGDAFVTALGHRTEALDNVLSQRNDAIGKTMADRLSTLSGTMSNHIDSVVGQLKQRHEALEQSAVRVENTVATKSDALTKQLTSSVASFEKTLDAGATNLENTLATRTSNLESSLSTSAASLENALSERNESFINTYAAGESGIRAALDESARRLSENVDAGKQEIEIAIDRKAGELTSILEASKTELAESVESKYGLFSKMLEEKRAAIESEFVTQMSNTSNTIDERSAAISGILSDRASVINETLGKGLADSQRLLNEKSNEINNLMIERTSELKSIIEEQAVPLAETIKTQGEQTAAQLAQVNDVVKTDVEQVIQKLGVASEAMGSLLIKAASDMSEMQDNITVQAEGMGSVVANAKDNVEKSTEIAKQTYTAFDAKTGELLASIGVIAERFDHQSSLLQHAASLLESTEENFSSSVESKNDALKQLAEGLVLRTGEIENSMEQFGSMLTRTMDDAAQRSRLVGSNIAEEVKLAMEDTHARFTASSEAMRQAALDVQRDLDETREQMRRGVIELPEETRQSADSMRKVVADQIAALRDLSEIVSRSGKALEAAPSNQQPQYAQQNYAAAPQQQYQPSYAAPAQPAPQAPIPQAPLAQAAQPQMRAPVQRTAPQPAPQPPRQQMAPAARTAAAAPRMSAQNQAPSSSSGWVSDLLRRADAPSQQAAPQAPAQPRSELHMVESLNSLSMDIARQIDHEASIDLWERYQRGERNVFTRRLYTLQGQQTFDEIQAKYRSEAEFRIAVDRYMLDFEKLLEEVAKNDRDGMMTQTYLTSDTGKVYTMLAHASGRLGN